MKFSVATSAFSDMLSLTCSVTPERSARAILQNLRLDGMEGNTIVVSATDLEIGLKISLEVEELSDPVATLLPASRLSSLVKRITAKELMLSIEENKTKIKTKQSNFQLPGADVLDYPIIPDFKPEGAVFIHGDDFADAVQKTVFATAKGDTRYALNGIFVKVFENSIEFVASDTHRLSLVKKKIRNPDNSSYEGILLTKGMATLARLGSGQETVELNITPNEMLAHTPNATLIIRRVDGMFPRYSDVIPPVRDSIATFNREEMIQTLYSIGLMASDETKVVKFSISSGVIEVSASSENGEGTIRLDAEVTGSDLEIKFNYVFLVDALKNMSDDVVSLQYKDADSPARLDSGDFLYVIMPVNR